MAANNVTTVISNSFLPDNSNWMSNLPSKLHSVPLNCLAIPGSHDSFTSSLDVHSDLTPDVPPAIRELSKLFGNAVKHVVYRWSITQSCSFSTQLKAGIRYFDLRVGCLPQSDDFFFMHGLHSGEVEQGLTEIKLFLKQNPKEVILLDLNHFYNMSEFQHKQCLAMLLEFLGELMCPCRNIDNVTLDMMWKNDFQVLVFYRWELVKEYPQFWPETCIRSPWANTYDIKSLMNFLEENYAKGRSKDIFYVSQGILTPNESYVMENMFSSLKERLCCKIAPIFVNWIKTKKSGNQGINICLMDYIEMTNFIPVVLALNNT